MKTKTIINQENKIKKFSAYRYAHKKIITQWLRDLVHNKIMVNLYNYEKLIFKLSQYL